jgi:hypothetical protein
MSLAIAYVVSLRRLSRERFFKTFWAAGFPPARAGVADAVRWLPGGFRSLVADPIGMRLTTAAAVLAAVGLMMLARRKWPVGALPAFVVAAIAAAALAHVYPMQGRLMLFLVPIAAIALAATVDIRGWSAIVPGIAIVVVAAHPVRIAVRDVAHPVQIAETRPVLQYIARHRAPGDRIYLHYASGAPFAYYASALHLKADGVIEVARDPCPSLTSSIGHGGRLWLFVGYHPGHAPPDENAMFTSELETIARPIAQIRRRGAFAVLYDLSTAADPERTRLDPLPPDRCLRVGAAPVVRLSGLSTGPVGSGHKS